MAAMEVSKTSLIFFMVIALSACTVYPDRASIEASALAPDIAAEQDLRPLFRAVFCRKLAGISDADCENELWRLDGESSFDGALPSTDKSDFSDLRIFLIGGSFSECFGEASRAWPGAIEALTARGADIIEVPISSRSSSKYNASLIAVSVSQTLNQDERTTLLVGYSKGGIDSMYFLNTYPMLAQEIDALVTIASPVRGSVLADRHAGTYDALFRNAFEGYCQSGDGGVLESLKTESQSIFLKDYSAPEGMRTYAVAGVPAKNRLSPAMRVSWQMLAADDPSNDGQVIAARAVLPGTALLGYVNADHLGLALSIDEKLGALGEVSSPTRFPRDIFSESVLETVRYDLRK